MKSIKIILTGATGMVGEGVLLECLENPAVAEVLMLNRRHFDITHPKLKELLVPDFMKLNALTGKLAGYDACFFCAGISSIGLKEPEYTHITYSVTLNVAETLAALNPGMTFCFVSGAHTDTSEKGGMMWARVKGRTENALQKLPFKGVYNFRPGFMKETKGQRNVKPLFRAITSLYPLLKLLFPKQLLTIKQIGLAMINVTLKGYVHPVMEIEDIRAAAS